VKPKGLQATATTETSSNFFLGPQGTKQHLKAASSGGGKRCQEHFEVKNLAIKLVEIA